MILDTLYLPMYSVQNEPSIISEIGCAVCQNIVRMAEYLDLEFCISYIDFTRMLYMESK